MLLDTPININMKKNYAALGKLPRLIGIAISFAVCIALMFFSCAGLPPERIEPPPSVPQVMPEVRPEPSVMIMGQGMVSAEKLAAFLLLNNTLADLDFVSALSVFYIEEAAAEGVNHDIAFAQMSLETGFLRFGNLVTPDMYNFAGLGATGLPGPDGLPERGLTFPDPRTGVRAHIQHLKGYASAEPLNQELVNPRYRFLVMLERLGTSPTIQGLAGTWAADPLYSEKIEAILNRLYQYAF